MNDDFDDDDWDDIDDEHLCPPVEERDVMAWAICVAHAQRREKRIMRKNPKPLRHSHEDWDVIFRFPVRQGELSQVCSSYLREWKHVKRRSYSMRNV